MNPSDVEHDRGYDLHLTPTPLPGVGYLAALRIVHRYGAHGDQFSVDTGSRVFSDRAAAVQHARERGRAWVDSVTPIK